MKEENKASKQIQSVWRGKRTRIRAETQTKAATKLQSTWRGSATRVKMSNRMEAAKQIQSKWRGHTVRKRRNVVTKAATRLQTWIRCRRCRKQFLAAKKIAEILYWNFQAQQYRKRYMAQTYFALKLQSIYRSWQERENLWTNSRSTGHSNMMALLRQHHSFKMREKDKKSWDVVIPPGPMGVRLKRSERPEVKGTYVSGFNDSVKNSPVSVVGVCIGAHITKIDGVDVSNMTHFKIIKILKRKMKETKMVTFTCLDDIPQS